MGAKRKADTATYAKGHPRRLKPVIQGEIVPETQLAIREPNRMLQATAGEFRRKNEISFLQEVERRALVNKAVDAVEDLVDKADRDSTRLSAAQFVIEKAATGPPEVVPIQAAQFNVVVLNQAEEALVNEPPAVLRFIKERGRTPSASERAGLE